jgi:hypothetical protein
MKVQVQYQGKVRPTPSGTIAAGWRVWQLWWLCTSGGCVCACVCARAFGFVWQAGVAAPASPPPPLLVAAPLTPPRSSSLSSSSSSSSSSSLSLSSSSPPPPLPPSASFLCETKQGHWFDATIMRPNVDGSLNVRYDDGEKEHSVSVSTRRAATD